MTNTDGSSSTERVAIFIDGSNLYHGLKVNLGKTNLDFNRFSQHLCGERRLVRTYYYTAPTDQNVDPLRFAEQQKFLASLYMTPYLEVKLGRLVYRGKVAMEKGTDIKLGTDMLSLAFKDMYDVAILVTGDGDFVDVVRAVKDLGKYVENASFRSQLSQDLLQAADRLIELDKDFLTNCWQDSPEPVEISSKAINAAKSRGRGSARKRTRGTSSNPNERRTQESGQASNP